MTQSKQYEDEIDLFELVQVIWRARLIVLCCAVLGLILGAVALQLKAPVYNASATLSLNYGSVSNYQLCEAAGGGRAGCLETAEVSALTKGGSLSKSFGSSEAAEEWGSALKNSLELRSADILKSAKLERDLILSLPTEVQSSERASTNLIQAERIIAQANEGVPFAVIGSVSVSQKSYLFIPVLGVLLGLMFGVFFVLIRSAYKNYLMRSV